jgi:hypothetical protein
VPPGLGHRCNSAAEDFDFHRHSSPVERDLPARIGAGWWLARAEATAKRSRRCIV